MFSREVDQVLVVFFSMLLGILGQVSCLCWLGVLCAGSDTVMRMDERSAGDSCLRSAILAKGWLDVLSTGSDTVMRMG